jgi:hypothetical protein
MESAVERELIALAFSGRRASETPSDQTDRNAA